MNDNIIYQNCVFQSFFELFQKAEKRPRFDLRSILLESIYKIKASGHIKEQLPPSFSDMQQAKDYIKDQYPKAFNKIAGAKKRSSAHLVAASMSKIEYLPVIVQKDKLIEYTNVFEENLLQLIKQHSKKYVVLNLPPAASLIFARDVKKSKYSSHGLNDVGDLIVGIDIGAAIQDICFYHHTLDYPISISVNTIELFTFIQRSHQNIFLISETCSCITRFNEIIEIINTKNKESKGFMSKVKHTYMAVKNISLNNLKSRDSKNDCIDASVLYVKGHTPIDMLPHSLISDSYCAKGKAVSRCIESLQRAQQQLITMLKNNILEIRGKSLSPNANVDDLCRECISFVLSSINKTKDCSLYALKQTGNKELLYAIEKLNLADKSACKECMDIFETKKTNKPSKEEADKLNLYGKKKPEGIIRTPETEYYSLKGFNLDYYEKMPCEGHITHKTPSPGYTDKEVDGLMNYFLFTSIISTVQQILMLQASIEDLENILKELIVPSNLAMREACNIPGIAHNQAFELVITLGDVSRFPTIKDALSYLGVVPTVNVTGHKKKAGKRLSKKGRSSLKKSLYIGQMARSMCIHFNCKNSKCSIWKIIAHSISIYIAMMKHNKRYMPLSFQGKHNDAIFDQFRAFKKNDSYVFENPYGRESVDNMANRLISLYKEKDIVNQVRKAHDLSDIAYIDYDDFDDDDVIPPFFDSKRCVVADDKYKRCMSSIELEFSLFKDFNEYLQIAHSFNNVDFVKNGLSNNLSVLLKVIVNEINVRSFALKNTITGNLEETGLLDLLNKAVNKLGKKAKTKLNSLHRADKYQTACNLTLANK